MTPDRLDEIDISIAMFRHTHPGSFGEMVGELRAEIDRLRDEVDALNSSSDRAATTWHDMVAERDTWKGRALGLQDERDRLARELEDSEQRVRVAAQGLQAYVEANSRSAAEVERLSVKAKAARDAIGNVELLHVWTNEDGKRFVFAEELWAALAEVSNYGPAALLAARQPVPDA